MHPVPAPPCPCQVHDLLHYFYDWLLFGKDLLRLSTGVFLASPFSAGSTDSPHGACELFADAGEDSHQERARLTYEMSSGIRQEELKWNLQRGVVASVLQIGVCMLVARPSPSPRLLSGTPCPLAPVSLVLFLPLTVVTSLPSLLTRAHHPPSLLCAHRPTRGIVMMAALQRAPFLTMAFRVCVTRLMWSGVS